VLRPLLQEIFRVSPAEVQVAGFLQETVLTYMTNKTFEMQVGGTG